MYVLVLLTEAFGTGGIQRTNRLVCLALSRWAEEEGHRVRFLSLLDGERASKDRSCLARQDWFSGFNGSRSRFVRAALREAASRPDVVYAAHTSLGPLAGALQALRPSLRLGVATYGIEVWDRLPALQRLALKEASFVTTISSFTRDHVVRQQGVDPGRVHLLPPVLDPFWTRAAVEPRSSSLRVADSPAGPGASGTQAQPDLPQGRILLSVTRLAGHDQEKGIDHVIAALPEVLEQVPDAQYVIVGAGPDQERLRALARDLRVSDRVRFLGQLAEEALAACYRACDLFVLPSKKEGFGIVFLEAMAFQKPVIAGAHGGSPEVVADQVTGILVRHGDLPALSQAIVRLLGDDALRQRMGAAGYERLLTQFTYQSFQETLIALVEGRGHGST